VVKGFVTAARYLTIIPLPAPPEISPGALGRAAGWFPVVGAALGLGLAAIERGLQWVFPPILVALLTLTVWKVVTGGLHLDGLADSLDGLRGRDRAERLRIMRDSQIGAFGAVGLILALLLALTALAELPSTVRWRALVAAPAIGRATSPLLALAIAPAIGGGQGLAFAEGVRPRGAAVASVIALAGALLVLGWPGVIVFAGGVGAAFGVGVFLSRRLGGLTGDIFGAGVEIAELVVLLTLVAWIRAGRP
jgi:adenosylcobinamide-GDP ribazoletransferase